MRNLGPVVVCLVLIVTYGWLVETKPQGGSRRKETCGRSVTEKPTDSERPEDYDVQHIETDYYEEPCTALNTDVEIPSPKAVRHKLRVENSVEEAYTPLQLFPWVQRELQECDKCDTIKYEQFNNSSVSCNHISRKRRATKVRKWKRLKIKPFRRNWHLLHVDRGCLANSLPGRIIKRSLLSNCSIPIKDGFVCRCVPQDQKDSLFAGTQPDLEPFGEPLLEASDDSPVNVDEDPPSISLIQQHITPLGNANEGRNTNQDLMALAELYNELGHSARQQDASFPLRYGAFTRRIFQNNLREVEPVENLFEPAAFSELNSMGNKLFGDFINIFTNRQQRLESRQLRLRSFLQSRRDNRGRFMNLLNTDDDDRKRRQCSAGSGT